MRLIIGLAVSAWCIGVAVGAPSANGPGGGQGGLSGTAKWDPVLWAYYCKHDLNLDVPAQPQPFPQHQLLDNLNGEFAIRLRCIIAVYQAASKQNDLGPHPGDGGLRQPKDQKKIYAIARKPKDGLTFDQCQYAEDFEVVNPYKVNTNAWVSWHELGVAADLRQFKGGSAEDLPPTQTYWSTTVRAMYALGMIWGGIWHSPWDYGHVEWHPYLREAQARNSQGHLAAIVGTPGHALTDGQMKYGYDWKIPQTIVFWIGQADNPQAHNQDLWVYTLVNKDNWICLQKIRYVNQPGGSAALYVTWASFDPPPRLFPVYSPVDTLGLNSRDDPQWAPSAQVTMDYYQRFEIKPASHYEHQTGPADLSASIGIHDWQKTAILGLEEARYNFPRKPLPLPAPPPTMSPQASAAYQKAQQMYQTAMKQYQKELPAAQERRDAAETRFKKVFNSSVYDISAELNAGGKVEMIHSISRSVDTAGYTEDTDLTRKESWRLAPQLIFSWDRDAGQIGLPVNDGLIDAAHPSLEVRGANCDKSGCKYLGDRVPKSISDMPDPPQWPPPNPRPKPKT